MAAACENLPRSRHTPPRDHPLSADRRRFIDLRRNVRAIVARIDAKQTPLRSGREEEEEEGGAKWKGMRSLQNLIRR